MLSSLRSQLGLALLTLAVTACGKPAFDRSEQGMHAFVFEQGHTEHSRFAPTFLIQNPDNAYNLIGEPRVEPGVGNDHKVYVSAEKAVAYLTEQRFTTEKDSYHNLIYRIHFEKIPVSLRPFHITTGRNIGLIVILTLNSKEQPVLVSLVHTCGCYLGVIPTSYLAKSAFPEGWNKDEPQEVYGEFLPGLLDFSAQNWQDPRIMLALRDGEHRVMDVWLEEASQVPQRYTDLQSPLFGAPIDALKQLPLPDGSTTSFYYESGQRRGYVKRAHKPLEMLFMALWSLDSKVGVDKEFGPKEETNSVFYTSLKFWLREETDLWDFPRAMAYWGWEL